MAKAKILIVEDEGLTGAYIKKTLKDLNYEVTSVEFTGEEAIKKASQDKPNLVLMDIKLQGEMDGIQAAEEIRTYLDIPIVYLTAHSDEAMLERAKVTEPFGYVIKPFESRELHSVVEMALYKHQMENKLKQLAHFDTLTGLPNRALFIDRLHQILAHAERYKSQFALLFIDLDEFKNINDTLGHDMGDLLLKEVGSRLLSTVRKSDSIARIGGDEFTVISREVYNKKNAGILAERIISSIKQPFHLKNKESIIGASIGISFYPEDGTDVKALLKKADIAMYNAKRLGKNNYQYFIRTRGRFNIMILRVGEFIIKQEGKWSHTDWFKLLLEIQKEGDNLCCKTLLSRLEMLLESLKSFYRAVQTEEKSSLIIRVCEETATLVQVRKESFNHKDLVMTLRIMNDRAIPLPSEIKQYLDKIIEAVHSLYRLMSHKHYHESC
jgi:diguanylate cyclase (GGDEF)-like protein